MNISTLSPVTCANWCESGDGHVHESSQEDQYCMGVSRVVPVSSDAESLPGELAVYEVAEPGQAVGATLSHNGSYGPTLTMDEVRALRDVLDSILSTHAVPGLYAA